MYELSYMEICGEPGNSPGIRSIFLRQLGIFAGFFQGFQVMEINEPQRLELPGPRFFSSMFGSFSKDAFEIYFQVPGAFFSGGVTLSKFNMVHLKMAPWNTRFLLETINFRLHVKPGEGTVY